MKKVLALILGLAMILGIASCAKKVEVPSKSDVKKAAAEEYDLDFKVDSEDISDDEKEAEWVLISKDGTLEVTVTWNAKNPDEFEFEDEELSVPTTTTTEETDPTTTETETPTTTTTEAPATSTETSGDGTDGSTPAPNPSGAKYVNFDEMNFYINGKKYTLGKTTLQDLIDDGVPFKDGELEDAKNNLKSKYQSAPVKLNIGDTFVAMVYMFNDTDAGKPMNECYVNEVYLAVPSKEGASQNVLTFDFPGSVTIDDLKANSGEPNENARHNDDNPDFVFDTLEYSRESKKFYNKSRYRFEFTNGKLRYVTMTYIP